MAAPVPLVRIANIDITYSVTAKPVKAVLLVIPVDVDITC